MRPRALYEGGTYAAERRAFAPLLAPLRRLAERDRLRFLAAVPQGARVLEVGAGDGRFVAMLAAAGFEARGIEPSPSACEAAARIGAPVVNASAEGAAIDAGAEDAVVFWHALEHTADPGAVVARAREWLAPGGRLIVAVPDLASLQARIGGDRWFHQDVPRHRTHFTRAGLVRLLERTGPAGGARSPPAGRAESTRDVADAAQPPHPRARLRLPPDQARSRGRRPRAIARDLVVTAIAGPLLVPVALGLELAAGLAGRGGSMVVEAVR